MLLGRVQERVVVEDPFPKYPGPNVPVCEQKNGGKRPLQSPTHLRIRLRRYHRPKHATVARAAHAEVFAMLDAMKSANELDLYMALTDPIAQPKTRARWRQLTADIQGLACDALDERGAAGQLQQQGAGLGLGLGGDQSQSQASSSSSAAAAMEGGSDAEEEEEEGDQDESPGDGSEPLDSRGLSRTAISQAMTAVRTLIPRRLQNEEAALRREEARLHAEERAREQAKREAAQAKRRQAMQRAREEREKEIEKARALTTQAQGQVQRQAQGQGGAGSAGASAAPAGGPA